MTDLIQDTMHSLIKHAQKSGADAADALYIKRVGTNVEIRDGLLENLEHEDETHIGLRVFCGKKSAIISTGHPNPKQSQDLAQKAVEMAKILPEDPYRSLCPHSKTPEIDVSSLKIIDEQSQPSNEELIQYAQRAEKSALSIKGVTKSGGSDAGWDKTSISLMTSHGFFGTYKKSYFSAAACVLAGDKDAMQRDYDFHCSVFFNDLKSPEEIGKKAGKKTVARLNPIQPKTGNYPVVFAPRVANSFLSHFAQLTNGKMITSGASLLKDRLGDRIFPENISIKDDPHRRKALRSRPFDAEGVPTAPIYPVQRGELKHWFLDFHCANQLGLKTHGQAGRSATSQPHPVSSNLYFEPGHMTPEELISDIKEGIYITEMMGLSLNPLTGDYSRGASGFMIRNGQLCEPISGFTLAGNLMDVFATTSLANDLQFQFSINAPTLRTEALKIAGH